MKNYNSFILVAILAALGFFFMQICTEKPPLPPPDDPTMSEMTITIEGDSVVIVNITADSVGMYPKSMQHCSDSFPAKKLRLRLVPAGYKDNKQ